MIRVGIADDQALVRSGLRLVLEGAEGIRVIGEATNGIEAVDLAAAERPDVMVMDIRMPELDGIAATERIAIRSPETRVLVVTTFDLDEYVHRALRAGAAGFLLKDSAPDSLTDGVRIVAAGNSLLAPSVTRQLVERFVGPEPEPELAQRLEELTPRERDVMRLISRGMSNAEIGAELYLGEATVKSHVTATLSKLGLRSRTQIVVAAYEGGVVAVGEQ
jgi:DNA-binding NarL/FixJ family response regulator